MIKENIDQNLPKELLVKEAMKSNVITKEEFKKFLEEKI